MQFVPGCGCCDVLCSVRVTVTAQCGGAVVVGATVSIAASASPTVILDTQTTNSSGQAILSIPSTGSYLVTRSKTGLLTTTTTINVVTCPGPTNFGVTIPPATFQVNFSGCLAGCLPDADHPIRVTCTQRSPGVYSQTMDITSAAVYTMTLPWFTGASPAYDYHVECPTAGYSVINQTLNPQCFTPNLGVGLFRVNDLWMYFPEYDCIELAPTTVFLTLGSNSTMWGPYAGTTQTLTLTSSLASDVLQYDICIDEGLTFSSFYLQLPFTDANDLFPCGCVVPSPAFSIGALIHSGGTCAAQLSGGQPINPTGMSNSYSICPFAGTSTVTATVGIHGSQSDTVAYTQ